MSPRQLLRNALWIGFLLRLVISVWNGFFGPSFGAEGDGIGLHQLAADFADGHPPEVFRISLSYIYALGAVYWLVTPSAFLGSLLSSLAWLGSAASLVASFRILGVPMSRRAQAMLWYGVLPSSILWTSVTMREPYQLLCVNVAIYAALRILVEKASRQWWLMLAAVVIGSLSHGALLGWGLCLATAVFGLQTYERFSVSPARLALAALAGLVLMFAGYKLFTQIYSYPVDRGLAFAINSYQQGGLNIGVRTDYRSSIHLDSSLDLFGFIPMALLQYLFEPMPWRITSIADLVLLAENLLRLGLIAQALNVLLVHPRRPVLFTFIAFLVLETAWAVGTFNWGTAARHHIPGYGLLLLAAYGPPRRPSLSATHDSASLHAA